MDSHWFNDLNQCCVCVCVHASVNICRLEKAENELIDNTKVWHDESSCVCLCVDLLVSLCFLWVGWVVCVCVCVAMVRGGWGYLVSCHRGLTSCKWAEGLRMGGWGGSLSHTHTLTHVYRVEGWVCDRANSGPTVAFLRSTNSCKSHELATATPPHDEGALQPRASSSCSPSSAAAAEAAAAGAPSGTRAWMLPGSGWATLGLHVHRLFWLCVSVCRLLVDRWGVPEAGHGDDGGVGLVSGPAGDHPDLSLCQRHGLQQGRRGCTFVFILIVSSCATAERIFTGQEADIVKLFMNNVQLL